MELRDCGRVDGLAAARKLALKAFFDRKLK
jgi:hypothetical protein